MNDQPDDLVSKILAENEKINRISETLAKARQFLEAGNEKIQIAKDKLQNNLFAEMLSHADATVEYYEKSVSYMNEAISEEATSPDIDQLIKDARDLLLAGDAALREGREIKFKAEDLSRLQTNIVSEMTGENWDLVGQYARDALAIYPNSEMFNHYAELAERNITSKQTKKEKWFERFFQP